MRPSSRKGLNLGRLEARILKFVLLIAVGLVFLLGVQVRTLSQRLSESQLRAESMIPGAFAPVTRASSVNGDMLQLGIPGGRGLVYLVYNTRCPFFEESTPAWKEIHRRVGESQGVRVLGLSVDPLTLTLEYQQAHSLPFITGVIQDTRLRDIHRLGVVPQVVILDSGGRVVLTRIGALELGPATDSILTAIKALPAR